MRLLKLIKWVFTRRSFERDIQKYCELEYSKSDRDGVFSALIAEQKAFMLGRGAL